MDFVCFFAHEFLTMKKQILTAQLMIIKECLFLIFSSYFGYKQPLLNDRKRAKKKYSFGFTALEATRGCEPVKTQGCCRHINLWFTAHAVASWYGRMAACSNQAEQRSPEPVPLEEESKARQDSHLVFTFTHGVLPYATSPLE